MDDEAKVMLLERFRLLLKWALFLFVVGFIFILVQPTTFCGLPAKVVQSRALVSGLVNAMITYHKVYDHWPDGKEMYIQLMGKNERKICFFDPPMKNIKSDGSVNDSWDHPIIFDGIVDGTPHFHSIGKDGIDQHGAEHSDDVVSWK